jgi:hypothetical protein
LFIFFFIAATETLIFPAQWSALSYIVHCFLLNFVFSELNPPLALYAVIVSHSHFQKQIPNAKQHHYLEKDFFGYFG